MLTEYLDLARERAGIASDNALGRALGVSSPAMVAYRRGLSSPTPERMVKLAELAGVSPELALLHRMSWQADGMVSRDVVSRMLRAFMGETPHNPLNAPKSLGAAAVETPREYCRLRYIMESIALWIALLIHVDSPPDDLRAA